MYYLDGSGKLRPGSSSRRHTAQYYIPHHTQLPRTVLIPVLNMYLRETLPYRGEFLKKHFFFSSSMVDNRKDCFVWSTNSSGLVFDFSRIHWSSETSKAMPTNYLNRSTDGASRLFSLLLTYFLDYIVPYNRFY